MALHKAMAVKRLLTTATSGPAGHFLLQTVLSKTTSQQNAARVEFRREFFTSSKSKAAGFFRCFLQQRHINNHSSPPSLSFFLTLPLGEKLREKFKSLNVTGDLRFTPDGTNTSPKEEFNELNMKIEDARKMLRLVQLEKVKEKISSISADTIPHGEFERICGQVCGSKEKGSELCKSLDNSGDVIVLGSVVFLRPHQVAKSMEKLLFQSIAMPNDSRREELVQLEKQKSTIDQKAQTLVQRELYFGLGFIILQTLGFMRLTFWELSWDVMEPICFFVTSVHFAVAYAFFLRTSKEPSFDGYFQCRFKAKQKKLMQIYSFDLERYNQLCKIFYCK